MATYSIVFDDYNVVIKTSLREVRELILRQVPHVSDLWLGDDYWELSHAGDQSQAQLGRALDEGAVKVYDNPDSDWFVKVQKHA